MMKLQKNKIAKTSALLVFLFLLTSCDFTPRIHQQILIAQKYITEQEYEKAVAQYHTILESIPSSDIKIKIYYQLGELYAISLGRYHEGIKYYEKIRELTTEPLWLIKTGERVGEIAYTYTKDYKKSESIYRELTLYRPKLNNYDEFEFRLADSLVLNKKRSDAEEIITRIQSNPKHRFYVESFNLAGKLYFNSKEWAKAISYFREYIKREARRDLVVNAKFMMANAYETMERLKTAYNIYYSILGEYPNTKVIQDRLKSVYERRVARRR